MNIAEHNSGQNRAPCRGNGLIRSWPAHIIHPSLDSCKCDNDNETLDRNYQHTDKHECNADDEIVDNCERLLKGINRVAADFAADMPDSPRKIPEQHSDEVRADQRSRNSYNPSEYRQSETHLAPYP